MDSGRIDDFRLPFVPARCPAARYVVGDEPPQISKKVRTRGDIHAVPDNTPSVYITHALTKQVNLIIGCKTLDLFGKDAFRSVTLGDERQHNCQASASGRWLGRPVHYFVFRLTSAASGTIRPP